MGDENGKGRPIEPAQNQNHRQEVQDQGTRLAGRRREDFHSDGITDEVIDRLAIRDAPNGKGWIFPWTDFHDLDDGPHKGMAGFDVFIPDRNQRRTDQNGREVKVEWPAGQPTYPGCVRYVEGATQDVIVEGPRQALAVASHAPDGVNVWVISGINGLNAKTRDRLGHFAGHRVTLIPDGDWKRNKDVGRAATETLPTLLTEAGAVEILVADVGGVGRDGADDVLGDTLPERRAKKLAKILDHAKPARDRRLELEKERQLILLQARDQARRQLQAMAVGQLPPPSMVTLADLLNEPDDPAIYRIDKLWPRRGKIVLAAQRKAGKTTLIGNLIRSLTSGDPFLSPPGPFALADRGGFQVEPVDGTVALLDLELDRGMLRRWLRDQGIDKTDQVMVEALRGRVDLFNIKDEDRRQEWIDYFAAAQVKVLIIDPLDPFMANYIESDSDNLGARRMLAALDAMTEAAGIEELFIAHHMGHGPERSRGPSALRGWPDAEWFLVREKTKNGEEPPPNAARFFLVEGRDAMVPETKLNYDQATRRLSVAGGGRVQHQITKHGPAILLIVKQAPGASTNTIISEAQLLDIPRDQARAALRGLIKDGKIRTESGPKRATLHHLVDESTDPNAKARKRFGKKS